MPTQYQKIVLQLLLALRQDRSAIELSKEMGYTYNQVKRWESGEKQLRWDEFCTYCDTLKIPITQILFEIFQYRNPDRQQFLVHLYKNKFPLYPARVLAKKLNRHVSALRRYLRGDVHPDLEFILGVIDLEPGHLSKFLMALLPADSQSPLLAQVKEDLQKKHVGTEAPLSAALHAWLKSEAYQSLPAHQSDFLAKRLGCSVEEVDSILAELEKNQLVEVDGRGKFVAHGSITEIDASPFWFQRAANHQKLEFLEPSQQQLRGVTACRLVSASKQTIAKIDEVILQADSKIRMILSENQGPVEDVRVILLKDFSTQDIPTE